MTIRMPLISGLLLAAGLLAAQATFRLQPGTQLQLGAANLVIDNSHVYFSGQLNPGQSEIRFTGDQNVRLGSGDNEIYRLAVDKTAGTQLLLADSLHITESIRFLGSGNYIRLGDHHAFMGPGTQITGFGPDNYLITDGPGALRRIQDTPIFQFFYPVGYDDLSYNPIEIVESGIQQDVYGVRVLEHAWSDGYSGGPINTEFVDASWEISGHNANGQQFELIPQWYAADELSGFNRSQSLLVRYHGSGWLGHAADCRPAGGNDPYHQYNQYQVLSQTGIYSVANCMATVLPLELLDFRVTQPHPNRVMLNWTTTNEVNTSYFKVERSPNGIDWQTLGIVAAAGFSQHTEYYEFGDEQLPPATERLPVYYYRLHMLDQDGTSDYSPIRTAEFSPATAGLLVFPNPSSGDIRIHGVREALGSDEPWVTIFDPRGQAVLRRQIRSDQTILRFPPSLSAGLYEVMIHNEDLSRMAIRRVVLVR